MLNKLINNFKQKKAGSDHNKSDREDQSNDDYSEDDSDNQSSKKSGGENKNTISTLIRVVVIIGLGYLAVDQFILKSDQQPNTIPTAQLKPKKNRNKNSSSDSSEGKQKSVNDFKNEKSIETASVEKKELAPEIAHENSKVDSTPPPTKAEAPVENITIAEKKAEVPEVPVEEKPQEKSEIQSTPPMSKTKEAEIDKNIDKMIDTLDKKENNKPIPEDKETGKVLLSEDTTTHQAPKLEDKIVADDNYTAPPAYDQLGRGLVYNCKDKYWACVEKASYVICNKNMKWNQSHNKPTECSVQNVYNSTEDCSAIQKFNVSTNKETGFCK